MTEVLSADSEFVVDRAGTHFYQNNPVLNGVVCMPITFPAGPRRGSEQPRSSEWSYGHRHIEHGRGAGGDDLSRPASLAR